MNPSALERLKMSARMTIGRKLTSRGHESAKSMSMYTGMKDGYARDVEF